MNKFHINPYIAFVDFLLVIVSVLIVQFSTHKTQEGVKPELEYMITADWDSHTDADVDLWTGFKTPTDDNIKLVFFNHKESTPVFLDRDSRGFVDNEIKQPDGSKTYLPNREIVSIRGIVPGTYTFGLHLFNYKEKGEAFGVLDKTNVKVHVEVLKIKPSVTIVLSKDYELHGVKQGMNFYSMNINSDGSYKEIETPFNAISSIYFK